MKKIVVLGSTGSIGTQTLNVARLLKDELQVVGLTCANNYELLNSQIKEFRPKYVYIDNIKLRDKVELMGAKMLGSSAEVAASDCHIVVTGQVGVSGVLPCIAAIEAGHDIALANKETLACCGELIMELARKYKINILPVDSEHSAIWQCLGVSNNKEIKRLILTASGGAFRGKTREELRHVSYRDALKHPTWNMGVKVTIDSASLMNKGLEVIEAMHLFNIPPDKINVIVHKESIIHSMVEYLDNSVIAQMSYPSMELPIQLALTYPRRVNSNVEQLDFAKIGSITFEKPDTAVFKCLDIATKCAQNGGLFPCAMNACNEVAVGAFIDGKIGFLDIAEYIECALGKMEILKKYSFEQAIETDRIARKVVQKLISQ